MKVEVAVVGRLPVPDNPYGLCGRKATLEDEEVKKSEVRSCVNVKQH